MSIFLIYENYIMCKLRTLEFPLSSTLFKAKYVFGICRQFLTWENAVLMRLRLGPLNRRNKKMLAL